MDFAPSPDQLAIRDARPRLCPEGDRAGLPGARTPRRVPLGRASQGRRARCTRPARRPRVGRRRVAGLRTRRHRNGGVGLRRLQHFQLRPAAPDHDVDPARVRDASLPGGVDPADRRRGAHARPRPDRTGFGFGRRGHAHDRVRITDGWRINGEKTSITAIPFAQGVIVFAKTGRAASARGVSAFLVPTDARGVSMSRIPDPGWLPVGRGPSC